MQAPRCQLKIHAAVMYGELGFGPLGHAERKFVCAGKVGVFLDPVLRDNGRGNHDSWSMRGIRAKSLDVALGVIDGWIVHSVSRIVNNRLLIN